MNEINQLIKKIEQKNIENSQFEVKQNESQEDVKQIEKCIGQKIKILRRHLEEKVKYGIKLQKNIETLHKQRKQLNEEEEVLDRVCVTYYYSLQIIKIINV